MVAQNKMPEVFEKSLTTNLLQYIIMRYIICLQTY